MSEPSAAPGDRATVTVFVAAPSLQSEALENCTSARSLLSTTSLASGTFTVFPSASRNVT